MRETWSISQVAERWGLSADTLRYYERSGVIPAPQRDGSGHRVYGREDVHLLEVLMHLKETGMPLGRIAEFTRLVASEPHGVPERLELLREHRQLVEAQLASWSRSLAVIDGKIADYQARLSHSETSEDD